MSDPIKEISLSRYAAECLAAHPELSAELASPQPFERAEMLRALADAGAGRQARAGVRLERHRRGPRSVRILEIDPVQKRRVTEM
jgi:hypothetical protein